MVCFLENGFLAKEKLLQKVLPPLKSLCLFCANQISQINILIIY